MDRESLAQHPRTDTHREQRECRSCLGTGWVLLDSAYDPTSGELIEESSRCFICEGAGEVSVYLYATPRRRG